MHCMSHHPFTPQPTNPQQGRECSREEYPGASAHGHRCAVLCFVWTLHGTSHHTCASPTPAGQHGNLPRCECAWRWMRCASLALHCMSHHPFTPSRAAAQSARVRVRMAMDALCFADERWLVCGSDTTGSAPSTIVLWDTSRPPSSSAAPSASPAATATPGASAPSGGDGGVALFDSRMHKAITRFSLGGSFEVRGIRGARGREVRGGDGGYREGWRCDVSSVKPVTSAAFSPCANPTCSRLCALVVWLEHAESGVRGGRGGGVSASCGVRCVFVDCGDEGVNDARWLSASPGLVTASGNGSVAVWDLKSVAVWDVSLADPLTAFSFAHTRSINTVKQSTCLADKAVALASPSLHGRLRGHPVTPALPFEASQKPFLCSSSPSLHDQVAVAPDDACIATGGDDQKVVLHLSPLTASSTSTHWKLTHPLAL
ncbi:unnamed protein product [Closterium sp. NIES-65]|nr:unnamed protein product [Closterium sp. NIES-65]